jgi:hypothetical protein
MFVCGDHRLVVTYVPRVVGTICDGERICDVPINGLMFYLALVLVYIVGSPD